MDSNETFDESFQNDHKWHHLCLVSRPAAGDYYAYDQGLSNWHVYADGNFISREAQPHDDYTFQSHGWGLYVIPSH